MGALEQLRALALEDAFEVRYPGCIDREEDQETYDVLLGLDASMLHRIGTCEYRIELVTEDKIYVMYRHLDEV
jgi:hypothetical protein